MDVNLVSIIISATITAFGIFVAYFQWRKEVQIKLNQFREEITTELVKSRVDVYIKFIQELEPMSAVYRYEVEENPQKVEEFLKIFQAAIYGAVGLLASQSTRETIIYARLGCKQYMNGEINYGELRKRIQAISIALRSDLGITQTVWQSEIDKLVDKSSRAKTMETSARVEAIDKLTKYDYYKGQKEEIKQ